MRAGDGASRARHPSGQWWPHPASLLSRVIDELAAEGHPFPRFAGAVLAARGRSGLDQATFSRLVGVPVSLLRGLESGVLHPAHAPPELARLVLAVGDGGTVLGAGAHPPSRVADIRPLGRPPPARSRRFRPRPGWRR